MLTRLVPGVTGQGKRMTSSVPRKPKNGALSAPSVMTPESLQKRTIVGVRWAASVGEDDCQGRTLHKCVEATSQAANSSKCRYQVRYTEWCNQIRFGGKGVELFQHELRFLVMKSYFWTDSAQGSYSNGNGTSEVASESPYDDDKS
ncbi:hypothetical protein EDD17DRAFT_1504489 [Pisolithus thermaeus]|nr:hypothetical protein EDD17DRAFT_1504489 [Pisolithus thermaeus]